MLTQNSTSAASSSESFWNSPQFRDFLKGLGAGLRSYDQNNMFAGMGAALQASQQRQDIEEQKQKDEERAKRMSDYEFAQQKELAKDERSYRTELFDKQRAQVVEDRPILRAAQLEDYKKQKDIDLSAMEQGLRKRAELEKELRGPYLSFTNYLRNQGVPTMSYPQSWHPPMLPPTQ